MESNEVNAQKLATYAELIDIFTTSLILGKRGNANTTEQNALSMRLTNVGLSLAMIAPDEIVRMFYTWKELATLGGKETVIFFGDLMLKIRIDLVGATELTANDILASFMDIQQLI